MSYFYFSSLYFLLLTRQIFAVNFAYSWGPVAWVLTQELFPTSMRARGVSIVASTNWMFNFVIGLTTKHMLSSMKYGTYIFFAAFCAIGAVFVWVYVPETKDKTLEELDVYFGGDASGIAVQDRQRMDRINASLGIAGDGEAAFADESKAPVEHADLQEKSA